MGLTVLSSLVFQFLARFVILYILVALCAGRDHLGRAAAAKVGSATCGSEALSWFLLSAPINALLLKLVMVLTVRGHSNDPIAAFVDFIGAIGVLSILITVDRRHHQGRVRRGGRSDAESGQHCPSDGNTRLGWRDCV